MQLTVRSSCNVCVEMFPSIYYWVFFFASIYYSFILISLENVRAVHLVCRILARVHTWRS